MARATQTARVRKTEKAVQTDMTVRKPYMKVEEPAEEMEKDENKAELDGLDPETDEREMS